LQLLLPKEQLDEVMNARYEDNWNHSWFGCVLPSACFCQNNES
jgi:hypothetical protein